MKELLYNLATSLQQDLGAELALFCLETGSAPIFLKGERDALAREKLERLVSSCSNFSGIVDFNDMYPENEYAALILVQECIYNLSLNILLNRKDFYNEIAKRSPVVASKINLEGDGWGLLPTSCLTGGVQWYSHEGMEVHVAPAIPGTGNSSLWLSEFVCSKAASDKCFIRPDPFRIRKLGSSFMRMERAAVFGKPFNRNWLKHLREPQSAQHTPNPDAVFREGHTSQFLWERISADEVQFSCEELPLYENPEKIGGWCTTRFVHGIYSIAEEAFSHLDGAVHIYNEEQYRYRLGVHLREHFNDYQKAKIFLFDDHTTINQCEMLLPRFYRWNKMIPEYFTHHKP